MIMTNSLRNKILTASLGSFIAIAASAVSAHAQNRDEEKGLDVQSSIGDMHLGNDADSHQVGLPIYPGARERKHDENRSNANLSLFTSAFGVKLVVLNYDSNDAPDKVIAYYRQKLKKYGKVLQCRTSDRSGDLNASNDSHDSPQSKELQCKGDQTGDTIELKAGTEDNQHLVAVSPAENGGKGSTFALVYVHTRGKQADI
jgi:hypothetical protein